MDKSPRTVAFQNAEGHEESDGRDMVTELQQKM